MMSCLLYDPAPEYSGVVGLVVFFDKHVCVIPQPSSIRVR